MFNTTERMRALVRHPLDFWATIIRWPDPAPDRAGDRELRWYPSQTGRAETAKVLAASQKFTDYQPPVRAIVRRFAIAVLAVDYGLGSGLPIERIYIAPNSRLLVGSDPGSDIVIAGSAKHAQFISDHGSVRVMDLSTPAGTSVHGEPLPSGEARDLSPGDIVHLPPDTTITCYGLPDY